MKNYNQVYIKNSFEAAKMYCKAFDAEITREFKNESNTAYDHCELSVAGEGFLALAEAKNPCDINLVHKYKWETMTTHYGGRYAKIIQNGIRSELSGW